MSIALFSGLESYKSDVKSEKKLEKKLKCEKKVSIIESTIDSFDFEKCLESMSEMSEKTEEEKFDDEIVCEHCRTKKGIVIEKDMIMCTICDVLIDYVIDSGPEYRWFGVEDRSPDPTRVGGPINPLLPESSLATRIVWRPGDCKMMRKIRQYHLYSAMPSRERTLYNVFETLNVRALNAGISGSILDEAKQLYAQISPRVILRRPQRDALLAACVFESLKRHGSARHPHDLAEMFGVDTTLITKALKQFSELLEEHEHDDSVKTTGITSVGDSVPSLTTSTSFKDYIEPALVKLDLKRSMIGAISEKSIKMGETIDEIGACPETTPPSLAAISIYYTCISIENPKTVSVVAKALEISDATLKKCLKRCDPWKDILLKTIS
jgi:transcription initiation factor TFIIB